MITAIIDSIGATERLHNVGALAGASISNALNELSTDLRGRVQDNLSGRVLNRHSGALAASIVVTENAASNLAKLSIAVTSDGSVPYARIQEFGGRIQLPDISPRSAKALAFQYAGKLVVVKHVAGHAVVLPERSYLRSALADETSNILHIVEAAVAEALA